ncbi:hypothetical protein [uncultured Ottowia sp.]|uniref:hypothetical protein n=1 Tax=uncultured Ottowia sp. TaxID=543067 RepID=UPI002591814E|nr:hypothetical protein [uncultured Ottowia sp.]
MAIAPVWRGGIAMNKGAKFIISLPFHCQANPLFVAQMKTAGAARAQKIPGGLK